MIDFHTHILPGIDDGSQDIDMTRAMLLEEQRQGVDTVIATPHFYADRMSIDRFLERRAGARAQVEHLSRTLPVIRAGAEVYYFQGMGRAAELSRLCIEGTRTLLVELPFEQWREDVLRDLELLIRRQGLNIVLAHVERYASLQRDRHIWNRVLSLPLTPQLNGGSFLRRGGLFGLSRRRFCLKFLAEHPRLIIGSDCHNMNGRAPNLAAARAQIAAALGARALEDIDAAASEALAH